MPFLQFPIFMAIYRAVSRIPYTIGSDSRLTVLSSTFNAKEQTISNHTDTSTE